MRDLFDIPEDVSFLNTAYMSPLPKAAVVAAREAAQLKATPWKVGSGEFFDTPNRLKTKSAKLLNAEAGDIAIVPSVSYAMASAAQNISLEAGREILLMADQFPANVYIWQEMAEKTGAIVRLLLREAGQSWTEVFLEAISPNTGLVACPQTHWIDGGYIDLEVLSKAIQPYGAALVLDLTQSLGVQPFDVTKVKPDFVVAAGYKWLMGPYSLGYMYVAPKHQKGRGLEQGWISRKNSSDFTKLAEYEQSFNEGAERFDMGERSNFQLLPTAEIGLDLLIENTPEKSIRQLAILTKELEERGEKAGLIADMADLRSPHYLSMGMPEDGPGDLLTQLAAKNVFVSQRGPRMRITPHLYTTQNDIELFAEALSAALR